MAMVRVRLKEPRGVGGHDGKPGDIFEVSRVDALELVGNGGAEYVTPEPAPYTVRIENPEHGDPAPKKITPAPTSKQVVTKDADAAAEETTAKKK
jgi:hypothetical protein